MQTEISPFESRQESWLRDSSQVEIITRAVREHGCITPEAMDRVAAEHLTDFNEALIAPIDFHFNLVVEDGELYTSDGENYRQLMWRALGQAHEKAKSDPKYEFYVERAQFDLDFANSLAELDSNPAGNNTLLAFSLCPHDIAERSPEHLKAVKDTNYMPDILRSFGWFARKSPDGSKIELRTMSFDSLDLGTANMLAGTTHDSTVSMLSDIHISRTSEEEFDNLPLELRDIVDATLFQKTGEKHFQGIHLARDGWKLANLEGIKQNKELYTSMLCQIDTAIAIAQERKVIDPLLSKYALQILDAYNLDNQTKAAIKKFAASPNVDIRIFNFIRTTAKYSFWSKLEQEYKQGTPSADLSRAAISEDKLITTAMVSGQKYVLQGKVMPGCAGSEGRTLGMANDGSMTINTGNPNDWWGGVINKGEPCSESGCSSAESGSGGLCASCAMRICGKQTTKHETKSKTDSEIDKVSILGIVLEMKSSIPNKNKVAA